MKTIDEIFSYTYFRINQQWLNWGFKDEAHVIGIIAMCQTLFFLDIWLIVYTTFFVELAEYQMPFYIKQMLVVVLVLFMYLNHKKYKNNYFIYLSKWKNEPLKTRRFRGWLIVICILLIFWIGPIYLWLFGV